MFEFCEYSLLTKSARLLFDKNTSVIQLYPKTGCEEAVAGRVVSGKGRKVVVVFDWGRGEITGKINFQPSGHGVGVRIG